MAKRAKPIKHELPVLNGCYAFLSVPLWIIGFLVISRSGVDVNSFKEEIDKLKKV